MKYKVLLLLLVAFSYTVAQSVLIQSAPSITLDGPTILGQSVQISLKAPEAANKLYILPASLGFSPGIVLPDQRIVPINLGPVFDASLNNLIGYPAIGALDNRGEAEITWNIPSIGGVEGLPLYFVFITFDPTLSFPQAVLDYTNQKKVILQGAETTCDGCSDCSQKLNGAYRKVTLTQSIDNAPSSCIIFNADNIIFDGGKDKGFYIDGVSTTPRSGSSTLNRFLNGVQGESISSTYGINFNGFSGNTLQNTEVKEFEIGMGSDAGNNNKITNSLIHFNTVDGIFLGRNDNPIIIGNTIRDNSNIGITLTSINDIKKGSIQNNIIRANTHGGINIAGNANGLVINDNSIIGNGISSGDYGLIFLHSTSNNNLIYHNNFISNFQQATDNGENRWDNGYPTGGNYWNDFNPIVIGCEDQFSGPSQNQQGSDGICDSPYSIGNSEDNYPFVSENGWV